MNRARWNTEAHRTIRDAHLRKARFWAAMARQTQGQTLRVNREHARQHVKAARRENWLLVGQHRAMSAGMFLRKTIGAHERAPRRVSH